ncbi:hypothetical protein HNR65_003449 [Desulfosalsimonas propionicica]|uniref:Uncharacterized protein n=1 Tax=Desulfosalsimonas propionicica TaxID=332175 RepID=A0A7W0CCF3_9BACT|nr:hypothetical protein [Desulfosalsimonas propionicica]MBA2883092.1 hypothetical protein [Desulfosalsimonas propionicica]
MKKQTEGKRFTRIERQELSMDDLAGVPFPAALKKIDEARQVAETILDARGLPIEPKTSWKRADGVEMHGFLDGHIAELYPKDSPEWYAAKIIVACHRLQKATGNQVAELAFQVGQLTAYARVYQMTTQTDAKGGSRNKRQAWADALAKELCHLSNEEIAWELEDNEDVQIEAEGIRYDILMEEDPENLTKDIIKAVPLTSKRAPREIRLSSFMRRYIQPARKVSK